MHIVTLEIFCNKITASVYSVFTFGSVGQHPMKLICAFESIVSNHNLVLKELKMKNLREDIPVQPR